ncbi:MULTISPECIES: hypothetical protein [Acidiphilium]|uniref:Phage DNA packaging protein, Nu1 subunit of terminase n=1 Tax=Acidiphilium rubrum TaxID=526 RepID=A0A8G2CJ81_ACIRU|nr:MULTISPECIES: hypothetical protein [Acidiphilium]SIQ46647.1 Phage DNA packaging protein, Nu1 subunit of terminase [Acidiphilium rubrum]
MATQSEVAAHLGIGQSAVAKLVDMGIFPRTARRGLDLDQCRVAYLGRLREEAAGRAAQGDGEELDLVTERARLAKEQADRIAMENDLTRRNVVLIEDVVKIVSPLLSNLRTRLLAIPAECAVALAGVKSPAAAEAIVMRIVIDALTDLASGTTAISDHCGTDHNALADVARPDASPAPTRPTAASKATSARAKATGAPKGSGKPTKAAKATQPRKGPQP